MRDRLRRTFASLAVRNYRLYFVGQTVSVSGSWMQQIAIAWLVLRLTNSPLALGLTTAAQTAPSLLVGVWGGLIADRFPKRRLLVWTQAAQVVPPLVLWGLTQGGVVRVWMVYAIVVVRGAVNTIDNPARQSFASELVGRERLVNAVSLNASIIQAGRLLGPAAAGIVIATLGLGPCFLLNALTFVFMICLLLAMDPSELRPGPVTPRGGKQVRAGLALAARSAGLRIPLLLMAVVGLLSFNFTVVLPAIARFTYHGSATTYALMVNFLAVGALGGALASGTRTVVTPRIASWAALVFGATLGIAALAFDFRVMLVALVAVGAASVFFSASVQTALQLTVAPEMRGRILSLYQIVYMGTTPIGAVLVGALAESTGARSGLVVGAAGGLTAGAAGLWASRRAARGPEVGRLGDAASRS